MGLLAPKLPKLVFFGINLPTRGIPPQAIFIKFGVGDGFLGLHPHTKDHRSVGRLQPQKSRKIAIFGINFPPVRKFRGFTEKVEYRCTTTNLPLCNDTIIVLKITLPHGVSVITNFVIPKRDKHTKTSHFFVHSRRTTHDPHHTWLGDRGGPYYFCFPNIF